MVKKKEINTTRLSEAFYEASKISFSLVFFPIVILLIGVWLDKKFGTIPLFIIVGIMVGLFAGMISATRIKRKVFSQKGEIKSG